MKSYRRHMWKKKKAIRLSETQGGKQQLPDLPEEIIEQILKRLPVESLVRFSSTCKRWRSLIFCNSKFNKAHIHHANRPLWKTLETGSFVLKEDSLRTTIDCDCNIVSCPIPTLSSYLRYPVTVLGSCNGLLFVVGNGVSEESKEEFVLWNPYTNSVKRMMGSFEVQARKYYSDSYLISGLTYDRATDDYKAIVVLSDFAHSTYVYSLRQSSWKKLLDSIVDWPDSDSILAWSNTDRYTFLGITLDNGICYWEIADDRQTGLVGIVCFDPVVEKFKEVPFPEDLRGTPKRQPLRMGAVDGCISFIGRKGVWVMKEYGCWTNLLVLQLPDIEINEFNWFQPLGYNSTKDKVVVLKSCGRIRILDVKNGVMREPMIHRKPGSTFCATILYTESLFCPWLGL